jgi:hypothetical protein
MNRRRVGEDRGSKETDGFPLTLSVKYVVAVSPGPMSLTVDVEIESTDTAVKRCTQALIDCSATGCFIDIEWAKLNNIPTRPLTNLIPVYNVDGTAMMLVQSRT